MSLAWDVRVPTSLLRFMVCLFRISFNAVHAKSQPQRFAGFRWPATILSGTNSTQGGTGSVFFRDVLYRGLHAHANESATLPSEYTRPSRRPLRSPRLREEQYANCSGSSDQHVFRA